jgi:phosphoserine phosphatase
MKHRKKPSQRKKSIETIKLVFFDMDGVLADTVSSWKFIHDYFGTSNDRSVDAYLKGKLDDLEFIQRDVSLWKTNGSYITLDVLENILADISLMKGAEECITFLRKHKVTTVIISAGLNTLAQRVAEELGIDYVQANDVIINKQRVLTGKGILNVSLKHKDKTVKRVAQKLNIPLDNCAAVGNSCFDIPMFEVCGIGIAFNPEDECVKESSDIVIEGKDLKKIIPAVQPYLEMVIQQ